MYEGPKNNSYSSFGCALTGRRYDFDPSNPTSKKNAANKIDADQDRIIRAIADKLGLKPAQVKYRQMMEHAGAIARPTKEENVRDGLDDRVKKAINEREAEGNQNPFSEKILELTEDLGKYELFRTPKNSRYYSIQRELKQREKQSEAWEAKREEKRVHATILADPNIKTEIEWGESEFLRVLESSVAPEGAAANLREALDDLRSTGDGSAFRHAKISYLESCIAERDRLRAERDDSHALFEAQERLLLNNDAEAIEQFVTEANAPEETAEAEAQVSQ